MMIGLAGLLNLYLGGLLGALAFGIGLLSVCVLQLDLFTGKMRAFWNGEISVKELVIVFLGNFVGILIIGGLGIFLASSSTLMENAANIMNARMDLPFGIILIRGTICGICVQLAVDMWKKQKGSHPFFAMLPATAFVLLGCNHCIADMLYWLYSGNWGQWYQIFEALVGNFIGATLFVIANSGIQPHQEKLP